MVSVDQDTCIGCGSCVAIAPDIFEIGDDGKAHVINDETTDEAQQAADSCPVSAIEV